MRNGSDEADRDESDKHFISKTLSKSKISHTKKG